jgi:hypothetical protein
MDERETRDLIEDIAAVVREFVKDQVSPITAKMDSLERDKLRERELQAAEYRARLAELDSRIVAVTSLERQVSERLASLKDGAPGRDGEPGRDGRDVEPEAVERMVSESVERVLSSWERPANGRDGVDGKDGTSVSLDDVAPLILEAVERAVSAIPIPKDGRDGRDGVDGKDGERGLDGDPGKEGPPGKMPLVREWSDTVYYEGDVVTHEGGTYQALRDTAKQPPHEDWRCIASPGRDGRSFSIRGTYSDGEEYRSLDVVVLNGASFAARRDDPGPCPGEGWQLIAMRGKPGPPGEKVKGDKGPPGPGLQRALVDDQGKLTLINADGSTVECDFYDLLRKLG